MIADRIRRNRSCRRFHEAFPVGEEQLRALVDPARLSASAANLQILLVVALGRPKETVVVETVDENGNIRYWRDEKGVHHVPKRRLSDIIVDIR